MQSIARTLSRVVFAVLLGGALQGAFAADTVAPPNYRLASGDSIRVSLFQNPDMTLETRVSEDGSITYPLIGSIGIGDLEIGAAEKKLAKALKDGGFFKQPQVNIQLIEVRGNKVAVLGQVTRAGTFPLLTTTRVSQMLAEAGGQTPIGADRIVLTGTREGKPFRREIDIDALYRDEKGDADVVLAGGDTIYVPRAPMFFIYGEVSRPGNYRIERKMTMRQAISAGGGLSLRGTERRLKVVHEGSAEKIPVQLDDPVQPGDVVYVAESLF